MRAQTLFFALAALEAAKDGADAPLDGNAFKKVLGAWSLLKYELEAEKLTVPVQAEVGNG